MQLRGKRILVTAASDGLGRAVAVFLASEGAHVAIHYDRDAAGAEQTATACGLASETVPALVRGDLGDWNEAHAIVHRAAESLGGLDGAVVRAVEPGPSRSGHFASITEAAWAERGEDPLRGALAVAHAGHALMGRHGGALVLLGAAAAHTRDDLAALAGGALLGLVAPLARALAPAVRVNGVALGAIAAEAHEALDESDERQRLEQVPLARLARPEDAAAVVSFFLSEDAAFVTGRTLVVDGGRSAF